MSEPLRYVKLPIEISAIELTQYGDFVRATAWVNENGGSASFAPANPMNGGEDYMLISTLEGNMEARVGWFVIQGVKGEFYPCQADIFHLTYRPVPVPAYEDGMTGTGMYVTGRPDGYTSLTGGAALSLPAT